MELMPFFVPRLIGPDGKLLPGPAETLRLARAVLDAGRPRS